MIILSSRFQVDFMAEYDRIYCVARQALAGTLVGRNKFLTANRCVTINRQSTCILSMSLSKGDWPWCSLALAGTLVGRNKFLTANRCVMTKAAINMHHPVLVAIKGDWSLCSFDCN